MVLSKNLKNFFNEKGYIILEWKIENEYIDEMLAHLDGKYKYDSIHYNLNNRIENAFHFSDHVLKLAIDKRILITLNQLLGGEFFPFQTLNFEKGTQQRLHSDWFHFAPSNNKGLAGVWVALEDTNEDNGSLLVVPGSHKLPYMYPEDLKIGRGSRKDPYLHYSNYEKKIEELVNSSKMESELIKLKKGQILIWHSNLIHGGSEIKDNTKTRYSQVTHYFQKGNLYFSPLKSKKTFFGKSYRAPFNILKGKRVFI